ncbi:hypothetical protein ACN9MF_11445 [Methylobacterium fujisawaense]|uniref:hypothetical protein n=1 Tax=Methylobacterium fujisawaense TaxID=107400 RepID=UPI003CF7E4A6
MAQTADVIPFKAEAYPIRVIRTRSFELNSLEIFTNEELSGLLSFVIAKPCFGTPIEGVRGLRVQAWKARSQGKSGMAQIIYFFRDLNMPLLMIAAEANRRSIILESSEIDKFNQIIDTIIGRLANDVAYAKSA